MVERPIEGVNAQTSNAHLLVTPVRADENYL